MDVSLCSQCGALPIDSRPGEFDLNVNVSPTTLARQQILSTTNEPPRSAEVTFIRCVVSKTGARLAHLDDEIARLRDRLHELEEERGPLATYHAQNKAILSPLRRMPLELLGEIFSWTLPTLRTARHSRRRGDFTDSPWVLAQICSRWRAVALSIPSLWSLVVINFSWTWMYPLSMIETQISRAQTLKVHFFGCQKKVVSYKQTLQT
ncbi:hypothetical protein C8R44DRAFT_710391 [Mycena epipterygia]|nr:hypothetical protein C8R44DRAFT_710391 [Mycena epipterygia]